MDAISLSDPADLKRLSSILQWLAIGLVFCGGVLQLLRFIVDQKERAISAVIAHDKEQKQQEREAALRADLAKSQKELQAVATRDVFRPLAADLRSVVIGNLRQLRAATATNPLKISLHAETGSRNRMLLRAELLEIFKEAGLDASEGGVGTTFATGPLPSIVIRLSEATLPAGNGLVQCLGPLIRVQFSGEKSDSPLGTIDIHLFGEPQFDGQGSVTFR